MKLLKNQLIFLALMMVGSLSRLIMSVAEFDSSLVIGQRIAQMPVELLFFPSSMT